MKIQKQCQLTLRLTIVVLRFYYWSYLDYVFASWMTMSKVFVTLNHKLFISIIDVTCIIEIYNNRLYNTKYLSYLNYFIKFTRIFVLLLVTMSLLPLKPKKNISWKKNWKNGKKIFCLHFRFLHGSGNHFVKIRHWTKPKD